MDKEQCLQLIELYGNNRQLWDTQCTDYTNKVLRNDAWRDISRQMGLPVSELKKKMCSLLGSYRREKSREKRRRTGSGGYKSRWYAYKALEFFKDRESPNEEEWVADNADILEVEIKQEIESNAGNEQYNEEYELAPEKKKPKKDQINMKKITRTPKTAAKKPQLREENREVTAFFEFIAEKMKSYSRETKNRVQQKIFQIIVHADQGYYETKPQLNEST